MAAGTIVLNTEDFGNSVAEALGSNITINVGDVTLEVTDLNTLLEEIKNKIPDASAISLDELISVLNELNIKITDLTEKLLFTGIQKVYGQTLNIPALIGDYTIFFNIEKKGRITGITYSQSAWKYEDCWDLLINTNKIFNNVYTKEYGENKNFYNFYDVNAGDVVSFIYHNNSASNKVLWVDLEVLESEDLEA